MNDTYLTISETSSLLNVNPETLRRWDNEGKLPAVKINNRGDRRWKKSSVDLFLQGKSPSTKIIYKGFQISLEAEHFKTVSGNFDLIGKYEITKGNEWKGCAFFCSLLNKFSSGGIPKLMELAEQEIQRLIDVDELEMGIVSTYEYEHGQYNRVFFPRWWEGPIEYLLVPHLKVSIRHFCPIAVGVEAWRCVLHFQSWNGSSWLTTQFGKNIRHSEYFIEVSAEYLESFTSIQPNEHGAKIYAMDHVLKRFNETANSVGERSLDRIDESKVAFWCGKSQIGGQIKIEDLMNKK
jgi:excisionase family DNA binding protein